MGKEWLVGLKLALGKVISISGPATFQCFHITAGLSISHYKHSFFSEILVHNLIIQYMYKLYNIHIMVINIEDLIILNWRFIHFVPQFYFQEWTIYNQKRKEMRKGFSAWQTLCFEYVNSTNMVFFCMTHFVSHFVVRDGEVPTVAWVWL